MNNNIKQWCDNHIITEENPEGTDCIAHLAEGRCFKCPYENLQDRLNSQYPCCDYKPK